MNPNDILGQMRSAARKALHLLGGGTGGSKLGGLPRLPSTIEWPSWDGDPLAFLGQIALEELPPGSLLQALGGVGMLYFFYDAPQSAWGLHHQEHGSWRVIYAPTPGSSSRAAPVRLEALFEQKRLAFAEIESFPAWDRLDIAADLPYEEAKPLIDAAAQAREAPYAGRPRHQVGGYPSGREDARVAAMMSEAQDWQLLLQLDTDPDTRMTWGDGGRLQFWIRAHDLETRDFSKVWMVRCG